MTLRLNGSTSGYVEIDAPATAGSNTLVLPTGNGTNGQYLQTNGSGGLSWATNDPLGSAASVSGTNFQFNSGYGSVATAYGCRAWVNFNGTSTVAIRASGNVSSVTDNGSGDYTVNFSTALSDANYCAFGSVIGSSNTDATDAFVSAGFNAATATHTTSAFRFTTAHRTQGAQDYNQVQVAVIR